MQLLDALPAYDEAHLAIETPKPRGMPTSAEEMDMMIWIGRILQVWGSRPWSMIFRQQVKIHLCGVANAKDPNIRQALIDRFGGNAKAVGGKKCDKCKGKGWCGVGRPVCTECQGGKWEQPPGPLYDISSHCWAALAIACYWADNRTSVHSITESKSTSAKPKRSRRGRTSKGIPADRMRLRKVRTVLSSHARLLDSRRRASNSRTRGGQGTH